MSKAEVKRLEIKNKGIVDNKCKFELGFSDPQELIKDGYNCIYSFHGSDFLEYRGSSLAGLFIWQYLLDEEIKSATVEFKSKKYVAEINVHEIDDIGSKITLDDKVLIIDEDRTSISITFEDNESLHDFLQTYFKNSMFSIYFKVDCTPWEYSMSLTEFNMVIHRNAA